MIDDMHNIYNRFAREAAAEQYGSEHELEITEIMEEERYCWGVREQDEIMEKFRVPPMSRLL